MKHCVKMYVSIINHLEVININVWNFNFPIGFYSKPHPFQGRIQDFKLGGGHLKKSRWAEGDAKFFSGISCEKSRFYDKKSYFFQLRREARKCLGYFVWKITILRQKIISFPILGAPPLDPPLLLNLPKYDFDPLYPKTENLDPTRNIYL